MHKIRRKTPVTESLFKRVALLIPATLLKERFRQIDFPLTSVQFVKMIFIEHFWVAASVPSKDFVILTTLAFFLCYPSFFVILAFLALVIVLKQTFNIRIFPKNTAHIEAVVQAYRKIHRKIHVLEHLFNKVVSLTLIKRRLQHRCFPVNFCEICKNTYFAEYLPRLYLPIAASPVEIV